MIAVALDSTYLGGEKAKAVLVKLNIFPTVVRVVITLATPHRPVILLTVRLISSNRSIDEDIFNNFNAASYVCVYTDCQKVVWCKKLVLTINGSLFGIVRPTTNQINHGTHYWLYCPRILLSLQSMLTSMESMMTKWLNG